MLLVRNVKTPFSRLTIYISIYILIYIYIYIYIHIYPYISIYNKGVHETSWKERFAINRKLSIINGYDNDEEIFVGYWRLKVKNTYSEVSWAVKTRFNELNPESKK